MEKRTLQEAYEIYEVEGRGYAVEHYISDIKTDDKKLNKIW